MIHVTMREAPCGCVVFYEWDDADPAPGRTHTAIEPHALLGRSTLSQDQLVRRQCAAHAGADHHAHFHNLVRSDIAAPPEPPDDWTQHVMHVDAAMGVRLLPKG